MLAKLFFTCNAVLPIILTILVGYVLKLLKVFPLDFFKLLNKLSFRCLLPTLLFYNVYSVSNLGEIRHYGKISLFSFTAILVTFIIAAILAALFIRDERQKGVMVQAAYRSNNAIIGISLVMSLVNGEAKAVAVASILSSLFIPMFNVLAVLSLTMFMSQQGDSDKKQFNGSDIIRKIITNPLILGCAMGFVVLIIRSFIPVGQDGTPVFTIKNNLPFLYKTIQSVAGSSTPIALIALGGTFTFSAVSRLKKLISVGTAARVVIVPLIVLACAYMLGFREVEFPALIALFATPTAVSSVPMAAEMNNDDELAGQLVVWTSISSAFSLFAIIFACTQVGIFNA